jgi:hypothetical protein
VVELGHRQILDSAANAIVAPDVSSIAVTPPIRSPSCQTMPIRPRGVVRHPQEVVGVGPDERVVGAIDDDELRTGDAVVEHLRVVDRYRLIVGGGDDERRTCELGQAAPAVERHRLPPRGHHQLAILVRHEPGEPVGTFLAELLCGL